MKAAYDSLSQPPMLLVAPVTSVAIASSLWLSVHAADVDGEVRHGGSLRQGITLFMAGGHRRAPGRDDFCRAALSRVTRGPRCPCAAPEAKRRRGSLR